MALSVLRNTIADMAHSADQIEAVYYSLKRLHTHIDFAVSDNVAVNNDMLLRRLKEYIDILAEIVERK